MKVSIIVPNYNGRELLEKNIPHVLKAKDNPKNEIKEVVVVDDGSIDDSLSVLNQFKGQIKVIKHTKNRGFSSAVNTGVRSSSGDLIVLLNSDVVPSENFLESVLSIFDDQKVFSVSFHEKGYGFAKGSFEDGYIKLAMGKESKKIENSFYVSGGSGAFRKSIWKDLGGLDENLLSPYYWEDVDLCFRASKRGYQNLWTPESNVTHVHESTISKLPRKNVDKIRERNQLLVIWKNIHSTNLIKKHIKAVTTRAIKHPGYFTVIFAALLRLSAVLKARKKEIKECVVGDEAVFQKYQ